MWSGAYFTDHKQTYFTDHLQVEHILQITNSIFYRSLTSFYLHILHPKIPFAEIYPKKITIEVIKIKLQAIY